VERKALAMRLPMFQILFRRHPNREPSSFWDHRQSRRATHLRWEEVEAVAARSQEAVGEAERIAVASVAVAATDDDGDDAAIADRIAGRIAVRIAVRIRLGIEDASDVSSNR